MRIVGIILPLYIMLRAITTYYQRRKLQVILVFTLLHFSGRIFKVSHNIVTYKCRKWMKLLSRYLKRRTRNCILCEWYNPNHILSVFSSYRLLVSLVGRTHTRTRGNQRVIMENDTRDTKYCKIHAGSAKFLVYPTFDFGSRCLPRYTNNSGISEPRV